MNPRTGYPVTSLAGMHFRPLSHVSRLILDSVPVRYAQEQNAESVGFEPTETHNASTVFKTATFGHSVNSPVAAIYTATVPLCQPSGSPGETTANSYNSAACANSAS